MEQQELYELSTRLNTVLESAKDLLDLHATRYRFFVDSSPRGFDCTYAHATARLFKSEEGTAGVITRLRQHIDLVENLVQELSDESP